MLGKLATHLNHHTYGLLCPCFRRVGREKKCLVTSDTHLDTLEDRPHHVVLLVTACVECLDSEFHPPSFKQYALVLTIIRG